MLNNRFINYQESFTVKNFNSSHGSNTTKVGSSYVTLYNIVHLFISHEAFNCLVHNYPGQCLHVLRIQTYERCKWVNQLTVDRPTDRPTDRTRIADL